MTEKEYQHQIESILPSLYRTAMGILKNEADCADCLQEAIFRGWVKRRQLKNEESFRSWMTKIIISEARNLQRKACRQRRAGELSAPENPPPSPVPDALNALPEKYRLPLTLFYLEGYSTREIAGILMIPEGRLRERMRAARNAMRRLITDDE